MSVGSLPPEVSNSIHAEDLTAKLEKIGEAVKEVFEQHEAALEQLREEVTTAQTDTTDANAQKKELLDRYKVVEKEREELKAKIKNMNSDMVEKERIIIMAKNNESEMKTLSENLMNVIQQEIIQKDDSGTIEVNTQKNEQNRLFLNRPMPIRLQLWQRIG